ncbi:MAG: UvrD-helicase domain-containing protein, partial [Myxococcales bacterium]|nr:UvrD-helicase domain-containing protein [Myxococcales bacterium]
LSVLGILREDEIDESLVPHGVIEAKWDYVRLLGQRSYFDYTAMILLAVELLDSSDDADDPLAQAMLRHVRDDLKFVVVDEYQDVNPLQERLIAGLTQFGANLCVVGDDDQTIYQWRGSEVRNIVTFADRHDDVTQVTLAENFRSSKGIVELGESVADLIPPEQRLAKDMIAAGHQQWARGDLLALDFTEEAAEVRWICDR